MRFDMNSKQVLTVAGLGALTVGLIALPSFSARGQNPSVATSQPDAFPVQTRAARVFQVQAPSVHSDSDGNFVIESDDDAPVVVGFGHGWLGAGVSEVTADRAKEFKLPSEHGVVLGKIVPDSPAAKAGLKENDVVMEINGQRVEGTEQFRRMIREIPAGRQAQLTIWRDGKSQTLAATIGKLEPHVNANVVTAPGTFAFQMPDMSHLGEMMEANPWFGGQPRLGIDAEDLEGDFGNYFGAPDGEGVLIRGVFSDSPAAKAGVKVGDVITSVDGDRVRSIGELREKLVEKQGEKNVKLGLLRNKAPLTLSVDMPEPEQKQEHHAGVRTNI
jgi:serine protease Do